MRLTTVRRRRRVIYLNLSNFYNYVSHKGIVEYAVENNWSLSYLATTPDQKLLAHLTSFDGAIIHANDRKIIRRIQDKVGIPVVATSMRTLDERIKHVVFDDAAVGRMARDHLVGKGFHRLLMVYSTEGQRLVAQARLRGLRQGGPTASPAVATEVAIKELTRSYLAKLERPLGIVLVNDSLAQDVLFLLADSGLSVPLEVAVLGIDNNPLYCESASIPLSSIEINAAKRGRIAADCLNQMMNGLSVPLDAIMIEPDGVVERASTEVSAIQDPPTVRALQYIDEHLEDSDLKVGAIARHAGVSRRRLETAFARYLDRSIANEILRRRIDWAIDLIREGEKSMQQIALQCGFSSQQSMSRVFRRKLNRTPKSYRS